MRINLFFSGNISCSWWSYSMKITSYMGKKDSGWRIHRNKLRFFHYFQCQLAKTKILKKNLKIEIHFPIQILRNWFKFWETESKNIFFQFANFPCYCKGKFSNSKKYFLIQFPRICSKKCFFEFGKIISNFRFFFNIWFFVDWHSK